MKRSSCCGMGSSAFIVPPSRAALELQRDVEARDWE